MEMYRPKTLGEALDLLAAQPHALLLAGGTDVMVEVNLHHRRPEVVISTRRIPDLTEMTDRFIGAGVTFGRLESSSHRGLGEAARTVGSPQIRAMATIGGNLGTASPAGDSLPFLVAAGAQVLIAHRGGSRRVPAAEFLVGAKKNALHPGELILGLDLPDAVPERQAFSKVGIRQAMTIAMANVCVLRNEAGETRVALGAVGPTVLRAPEAEKLAAAEEVSESMLQEFQRLVSEAAQPITDHRGTAEYRRRAVGVIARRALERTLAS